MSDVDILPFERREEKAPLKREVSDSNIRREEYFNPY
jgi:hypothetical protein